MNIWQGMNPERRACRFSSGDGLTAPRVNHDSKSEYTLPCDSVIKGSDIPLFLAGEMVSRKGCLSQRKEGLCPRGLGEEVPQRLIFSSTQKV